MKNNSEIYRANKLNLLLAAFILLAINLGCSFSGGNFAETNGPKPDMPSTEQQNVLVKETLKEFTKGIESGDFSSLRANSSKEFQSAVSAENLKKGFQSIIDKKDSLVPILKSADSKTPQFSNTPEVKQNGAYTTQYSLIFPVDKLNPKFDLIYIWQDSEWKLLSIEVKFNSQ